MSDILERARAADDRDIHLDVLIDEMADEIERLRGLLREWLDMNRLIREGKPIPMNFIEQRVREALGDE